MSNLRTGRKRVMPVTPEDIEYMIGATVKFIDLVVEDFDQPAEALAYFAGLQVALNRRKRAVFTDKNYAEPDPSNPGQCIHCGQAITSDVNAPAVTWVHTTTMVSACGEEVAPA
jgi:hypothetical protein